MGTTAEKRRKSLDKMTLRQYRRFLEVTLDELALELGEGYSTSRLSLMERGLYPSSADQERALREAIQRIAARRREAK